MRHRKAYATILAASALDVICGLLYAAAEHIGAGRGLYCAAGNAVTEGACTAPTSTLGHWINLSEFLLVVPLFAATFSLITSGLTERHVKEHSERIRDRLERRLDHIIAHHPDLPPLSDETPLR